MNTKASKSSQFLNALFGSYEGAIRFVLNDEVIESNDPAFVSQNDGNLRVSPATEAGIFFLFAPMEESEKEDWRNCRLEPTAVLWRDGISLFCWALDAPALPNDADIAKLMDCFQMQDADEPIPMPGTDDWELVHVNNDAFYTIDELRAAYLPEPKPEKVETPPQTYRDAVCITPYNEDDYEGRDIWITIGAHQFSKDWVPTRIPVGGLVHQLTKHEIGKKDGVSIVFGDMVKGQRKKKSVKTCTAIPLDIDTGYSGEDLDRRLAKLGHLIIRYTTNSHNKTSSDFLKDKVLKMFPDAHTITSEMLQEYARSKERWEEAIASTVEYVEDDQTEQGIVVRVSHAPLPKHRIVIPLLEPFVMKDEARLQQEAMAKWAKVIEAMANTLGVVFDRACTDPSRVFFMPRHQKGRPFEISLFGGPLFNWRSLSMDNQFERIAADFEKGGSKSKTLEGKNLGKWSYKYGAGFQIADVIEEFCPDKKRSPASNGFNIECPFDEDHSNAGESTDQACFAVNAADGPNEFFLIKCQHESCKEKTSNDMLGKMLKDEWFEWSVIEDPRFNIIDFSAEEEADKEKSAGTEEAELLPDLKELKDRIVALPKAAERDVWFPVLEAIEGARLKPGDRLSAHTALVEHLKPKLTRAVLKAEIKEIAQAKQGKPNEKTMAKSDQLKAMMEKAFGSFTLPNSELGGEVHLDFVDGRPWLKSVDGVSLCTPFAYDGSVTYPDEGGDRGVRVRVFNSDNKVVSVEFDAALLGYSSGNEVIGKLRAKGWVGWEPGRKFILGYLGTQQLKGITVYHRPGFRDGVFVLATGDVISPEGHKGPKVELHASSLLKGPIRAGKPEGEGLEAWKKAAAKVFANPDAWHYQLGILLGVNGPIAGYANLDSLVVFLGGGSRAGKTTTERCAGAHYATNDEKKGGGCVENAHGTANSHEITMQQMSCLVLCYDEFAKLPPKEQAQFAFRVSGGRGKRSMNKDRGERTTRQWHGLCVIVSAENSLGHILAAAGENFDAGMTARLLPINMNGTVRLEGEDWKAVQGMLENYGYSGPAFISGLLKMDPKAIADRLDEITDTLPHTTGEDSALRRSAAGNVARIQLAAELMAKMELIPKDYDAGSLTMKIWQEFLRSDTAPIVPAERGFRKLCANLILWKGSDVVNFEDRDEPRSRPALAYHNVPPKGEEPEDFDKKKSVKRFYVIPTDNIPKLSGGGADTQTLKRLLEDRGYLERPPGKRGEKSMTWPHFPKIGRSCIVLIAEKVDEGQGDEDLAEMWGEGG